MSRNIRAAVGAAIVLASIAASAAFAAEPIRKGVDLWMTVAGMARTSFAQEPIPAGFFCPGSQPFTGTIAFKGAPLAVTPPQGLRGIDTVVRRLDDAPFNDKGEATTRIQLMALSLVSIEPIETSCGKYDVAVSLAEGEQPVTTMRILRTDALGGTYSAPLSLDVKVVFTPAGTPSARRELTRRIDLGPANGSVWAYTTKPRYATGTTIDTNGDGRPDTVLPAPSNFRAGVQPAVMSKDTPKSTVEPAAGCYISMSCGEGLCPYQSCHCDLNSTNPYEPNGSCDHLHCIWTCVQSSCCNTSN
ncbi:MAG: hypothetical protein JOZ15_00685 [Acidobacteria bacterium]|nr:hypothetical protein [Acidobacteriota bacterium]